MGEQMSDLLPCPFCGEEPELRDSDDEDMAHIACSHCDIQMCVSAVGFNVPGLVRAWNTRAIQTAKEGE